MHAPLRTKQQQQQQQLGKNGDSNNIKHFAVQWGFTLVKMGFGVQRSGVCESKGVLLLAYIDTEMGKTYGGAKVEKKKVWAG